jgi:hypothetical protein
MNAVSAVNHARGPAARHPMQSTVEEHHDGICGATLRALRNAS